ncbi:hypothetical protein MPS_1226 [Mycobacterium pseudoshottsii JCM 15466]|nr:hypothetical protein MPS_1226 [Mycobacterium pseudoshottsii JCM 15466]
MQPSKAVGEPLEEATLPNQCRRSGEVNQEQAKETWLAVGDSEHDRNSGERA